ncbi:MAG: hypothetical protein PHE55_06000, partial [Methylococcaceae bacterium]|nr:hypothetical protein [Methylococcaceae bacterium]
MATQSRDRLAKLKASTVRNGIDFVEVASNDQKTLIVHFINDVEVKSGIGDILQAVSITGGERIPVVPVNPIHDMDWKTVAGNLQLTLTVDEPGDFSYYTLTLNSAVLDDYFKRAVFSFKIRCPSTLDCADQPPPCPEEKADLPPIDYLAKDFLSFRKALSD